MEEIGLIVMLMDKPNGTFEKMLVTYRVFKNQEYVNGCYAISGQPIYVYLKLSTESGLEIENWQFNAIFDYYDTEIFSDDDDVLEITEDSENNYNPTWLLKLEYLEDQIDMEEKIERIILKHKAELEDVLETIKDKKEEYTNEL